MDTIDFSVLKADVENTTGFKCYEGQPGEQQVWFGINNNYAAFKEKVANKLTTGSVAVLLDKNLEKHYYYRPTNRWY